LGAAARDGGAGDPAAARDRRARRDDRFSSPLTAARTNTGPAWLEWLIFPHHVNYHIEHHLYASVPHYNLPALHREMAARGVLEGPRSCLSALLW
jgi:fatty acid desaturase